LPLWTDFGNANFINAPFLQRFPYSPKLERATGAKTVADVWQLRPRSYRGRRVISKFPNQILKIGVLNISSRQRTSSPGTNLSTPSGRDM
jgi:hypothetical protein